MYKNVVCTTDFAAKQTSNGARYKRKGSWGEGIVDHGDHIIIIPLETANFHKTNISKMV